MTKRKSPNAVLLVIAMSTMSQPILSEIKHPEAVRSYECIITEQLGMAMEITCPGSPEAESLLDKNMLAVFVPTNPLAVPFVVFVFAF